MGILPALEHRGRSASYRRLIRNLFVEIELKPGERILDVGCGSGVVDRWLVQQTNGQNPLWGVDANLALVIPLKMPVYLPASLSNCNRSAQCR